MDKFTSHQYDVVIIGAGGAGLRAAIEASARGVRTAVICKSLLGKAHTVMAEGGVAAALANVDQRDNWKVHFRDTMKGGKYLNQWRMAQLHAQEAPDRVNELEEWGAVFDRTKRGLILQRNFGGHTYPRLAHVGDRTGLELIRTLQDRGVHSGIDVFMEYTVRKILTTNGEATGCLCYQREKGLWHVFQAKAIVIATGGIGQCWEISSNSWEYTADGHALALWAGAELLDMEFVQFHPTGMVWPPSVKGTLITEGVRGEGGILKNSEGKRFMFNYVPDMYKAEFADTEDEANAWVKDVVNGVIPTARRPPELLTRDVVARAIRSEVLAGRGAPHGGVWLDIASRRPEQEIKKKLPGMYHQFRQLADVDITKEPMEVGPTCHYMMGGVRVHPETQESTLPGLFAAGEVAAGLHGSNRLGGNSLSDLLVFGKRAGEHAAKFAQSRNTHGPIPNAQVEEDIRWSLRPFEEKDGENPYSIHHDLQKMMQHNVGIVRSDEHLREALEELGKLRNRAEKVTVGGNVQFNPGWHLALDLRNMLDISEAVTKAALERSESRGAHTREDHLGSDDEWGNKNLVVEMKEGQISVKQVPLEKPPEELQELLKD